MDRIKEIIKNPLLVLVVGVVIGIIIGLPILGWGIWPVVWVDAEPSHLRVDLKEDYLRMVIDSYARTMDQNLAVERYKLVGADAPELLSNIKAVPTFLSPDEIENFRMMVNAPDVTIPSKSQGQDGGETTGGSALTIVVVAILVITVLIGALLAYLMVLRKGKPAPARSQSTPVMPPVYDEPAVARSAQRMDYATHAQQENPVSRFMTTYNAGNDLYDDSFSIDTANGEFLGECGVGISDVIGTGEPKKITAFEVWLFDKNDIQTVTKVLMSANAFHDNGVRQKLAAKGEPILVEPGQRIILETATLQLEARVVDLKYSQGSLPSNSVFDELTLELAVWQNSAQN